MKKLFAFLGAAVLALAFTACSMGPTLTELQEKDSGKTLTAKVGDRFTILLESNPTTGYMWKFAGPYDEHVAILCGDAYVAPSTQLVGAPGQQKLTFEVVGPGRTGIRLAYVRPWERDTPPAKTFQLLVFGTGNAASPLSMEDEAVKTPRIGSKGQVVPEKKGVFE